MKLSHPPPQVIQIFNEVIQKHWDGKRSVFKQSEVVALIRVSLGVAVGDLFSDRYLDVEELYRREGWTVTYNKPARPASGDPMFTFEAADK